MSTGPYATLIRGGTLILPDGESGIRAEPGDLLMEGDRIARVGVVDDPPEGARVIYASGCAVLPGFVQTHVHLCQTLFRGIADELPLLDQYSPYADELQRGPYMLSYRRLGLAAIPKKYHALIPPEWIRNEPPTGDPVAYMFDNLLDIHLAEIPGWFLNRHPNPAGYQVIGAQLADYLAPRLRKRANA